MRKSSWYSGALIISKLLYIQKQITTQHIVGISMKAIMGKLFNRLGIEECSNKAMCLKHKDQTCAVVPLGVSVLGMFLYSALKG